MYSYIIAHTLAVLLLVWHIYIYKCYFNTCFYRMVSCITANLCQYLYADEVQYSFKIYKALLYPNYVLSK